MRRSRFNRVKDWDGNIARMNRVMDEAARKRYEEEHKMKEITVTFQGPPASGKTQAMELFELCLRANGYTVVTVNEDAHTIIVRASKLPTPPHP